MWGEVDFSAQKPSSHPNPAIPPLAPPRATPAAAPGGAVNLWSPARPPSIPHYLASPSSQWSSAGEGEGVLSHGRRGSHGGGLPLRLRACAPYYHLPSHSRHSVRPIHYAPPPPPASRCCCSRRRHPPRGLRRPRPGPRTTKVNPTRPQPHSHSVNSFIVP
jgi:hypothetical protein